MDPIVQGGSTGVWLFFGLSGYLLYRPFLLRQVDLVGYGLKRGGRILPGYFVALVGLTLVTQNHLPIDHPLPYLAIASGYDVGLRGFLGNAWTLSAEILFYVTLPLISRLAAGRELEVPTALGLASLLAAIVHNLLLAPGNAWLFGTFPLSFYAFLPGMLLAVLEVKWPLLFRALSHPAALWLGVGGIVLGTLTSWLPVAIPTGIGTGLLMAYVLQHPLPYGRALGFAGGASYGLYLWHKDALIAFGPVLGLAIAVIASGVSWVLVERPILAAVHAFDARRRRSLATQPGNATP